MLATFFSKGDLIDNNSKSSPELLIIDTFYFFGSDCSGFYSGKQVSIAHRIPENYKHGSLNIFFVGGIGIADSTMAVSIFFPPNNEHQVNFFSIFGNQVKLKKKKFGVF